MANMIKKRKSDRSGVGGLMSAVSAEAQAISAGRKPGVQSRSALNGVARISILVSLLGASGWESGGYSHTLLTIRTAGCGAPLYPDYGN